MILKYILLFFFLLDNDLISVSDPDGTLTVLQQSLLRFGNDYRLKEVRRILRSETT